MAKQLSWLEHSVHTRRVMCSNHIFATNIKTDVNSLYLRIQAILLFVINLFYYYFLKILFFNFNLLQLKIYLTNIFFHSKINTGNGETTKVVCRYRCKKHISRSRQMCFFIGYFCLLIITTNAIIKANVMIVTDTRPVKSNFIINNKVCTSIIRLTSFLQEANHICLFSFPVRNTIQYFFTKNK